MRGKICALFAALLVAGAPVFAKAVDSDNDGIKDRKDLCANTPVGAKVDKTGCPVDDDADGIANGIDRCGRTQAGWTVDAYGCPSDTDRDGIVDAEDSCPATLLGARPDAHGCPTDLDGDLVADGLDRCASTPTGYRVDSFGCPTDMDHDGINDALDKCADSRPRVTVDQDGCQVKAPALFDGTTEKVKLQGVTFEKNQIEIPAESTAALKQAADALLDWPETKVEIGVHTDKAGSAATNLELSKRRAEYVKNYLVAMGVEESRLVAKGYGEKGPDAQRSVELTRLP